MLLGDGVICIMIHGIEEWALTQTDQSALLCAWGELWTICKALKVCYSSVPDSFFVTLADYI